MILLVFVVIFLVYLFVGMGCGLPGSFPLVSLLELMNRANVSPGWSHCVG